MCVCACVHAREAGGGHTCQYVYVHAKKVHLDVCLLADCYHTSK